MQLFQLAPWINSMGPMEIYNVASVSVIVAPSFDGNGLVALRLNPDGSVPFSDPTSLPALQAMKADLDGIKYALADNGVYMTPVSMIAQIRDVIGDVSLNAYPISTLFQCLYNPETGEARMHDIGNQLRASLWNNATDNPTLYDLYLILSDVYDGTNHCLRTRAVTP